MDEPTLSTLKRVFREFYFRNAEKVGLPTLFERREFGYAPFEGGMIRHLAFKEAGEIKALLVKEVPRSVFYSVSYYLEPSFQMMEKGWIGGDLAFDIDADDLDLPCKAEHDIWTCVNCGLKEVGIRPERCPRCGESKIDEQNWSCKKCVGGSKEETLKLLDILMKDFGLAKSEIRVYFSGSMGFHVAVQSKKFEEVDQMGRNDIADHVAGLGLTPALLGIYPQSNFEDLYRRLPTSNEGGWRGRVARYFKELDVQNFEGVENNGKEKIAHLYKTQGYSKFRKELEEVARKIGVPIDTSVTTDIHRIFRLPETLHGETGFLKKRCDDLYSFDPFSDAVALGDEPLEIFVDISPAFSIRGENFGPYRNEQVKLPTMAGVYLLGRGAARVL